MAETATATEDAAVARIVSDASGLYYFEQGGVKIPMDKDSLVKSVGMLDQVNHDAWITLAAINHLPVEPFSEKLLKPVLMGIVQNAWYQHFDGKVPEKCLANHENRIKKYLRDLEEEKSKPQPAPRAAKTPRAAKDGTPRAPRAARGGYLYRIKTWADVEKLKGQQEVIVKAMRELKGGPPDNVGLSTSVIAKAIEGKLTTRQPEERVVSFYMNDWQKRDLIVVVGEQTEIPPPAAPAEPAKPAEPEKKATPNHPEIERVKKMVADKNKKKKKGK